MRHTTLNQPGRWMPGLACALLLSMGGSALADPAPPPTLAALMQATGLKYALQGETTACLLMGGPAGVHPVIVRLSKGRVAAMAEIATAPADDIPTALWKKLAQVNAVPRLAHAGLQGRTFYAITGATVGQMDGTLLKAMITDVAALTDELQPALKDLLAVE